MKRAALLLMLLLAGAAGLVECAQFWGWAHVLSWSVQGGLAGGLGVWLLNRQTRKTQS